MNEEVVKIIPVEKGKTVGEVAAELEAQGAEVEQVDPQLVIEQYLSDSETQAKLNEMAIHFSECSKNKWVSARELQKKSTVKKPEELYMMLDLLVLSRKALSKKVGDLTMYRFTLSPDQRKKVLVRYIKELEVQLESLRKELTGL